MEDLFKVVVGGETVATLSFRVSTANAIKVAHALGGELQEFDHISDCHQRVWPFTPGVEICSDWKGFEAEALA